MVLPLDVTGGKAAVSGLGSGHFQRVNFTGPHILYSIRKLKPIPVQLCCTGVSLT